MKAKFHRPLLGIASLIALSLACSLTGGSTSDLNAAATQTLSALATIEAGTLQALAGGGEGAAPTTEAPAATEAAPAVEPTATPTVAHVTQPSNPGAVNSFMTDRSTKSLASERRANADNFDIDLLERPFTSQAMDYRDYLDLTRAELSLSQPWVYVTLYLEGGAPQGTPVRYGVEVDLDIDGRGDWLITGLVPPSSDWTTDGVRACRDSNNDVGGSTPIQSNAPNPALDGYDDCVFENGYGIGPDEAWIRRDPAHADRVQIAFMHSLIGSDGQFMWGGWADEGVKEPAWYDYNDHFTPAEAGSPASESSNYPLKALALVDNTCRWGYGFTPTGSEPGVCYIPPTPTPVPPGSISGAVFRDDDHDGVLDGGEGAISGIQVRLGSGACASSGLATSMTDGSLPANFSFTDLNAGIYCVTIMISPIHTCGGWQPDNTSRTVNLGPGENAKVDFGFWLTGPC